MPSPRRRKPLFTQREYQRRDLKFHDAYARLPIVQRVDGLGIRWFGPLVELALDTYMEELEAAAYGYIEDCGWQTELEDARMVNGAFTAEYEAAFGRAARALAEAGERAGPDPDPEVWASWLAFTLASPHQAIRDAAVARGWDR